MPFFSEQCTCRGAISREKIIILIDGMLELPIVKTLGIEHLDIVHGSEKTIGFTGAYILARLLCRKGRDFRISNENGGSGVVVP